MLWVDLETIVQFRLCIDALSQYSHYCNTSVVLKRQLLYYYYSTICCINTTFVAFVQLLYLWDICCIKETR